MTKTTYRHIPRSMLIDELCHARKCIIGACIVIALLTAALLVNTAWLVRVI